MLIRLIMLVLRLETTKLGWISMVIKRGMTVYYSVENIKQTLENILDSGAQIQQNIKDVAVREKLQP